MVFPYYIQKAIDLGLLVAENGRVVGCNEEAIDKTTLVARIVDKLQPTSIQERDDTTNQEAIVLSRILTSPSGLARELWSELRTGFGMGHGQPIPVTLWSDHNLRIVAREIDLTFMGERSNQVISKESLITAYGALNDSSKSISLLDFTRTVSELSDPETLNRYGDAKSEWATALDILKQVRVRANYLEALHTAKQNFKADTSLEEQLEFLQQRAMEGVSMMRGAIGNQGQAVELINSIVGNAGPNRKNWIDHIITARKEEAPVSTGITAFDIDIDGGVSRPQPNRNIGGRMLTVAARTGVGKTAIGVHVATSLMAGGLTVGFISAELDMDGIEARIIASLSMKVLNGEKYYWKNSKDKIGYVTVGDMITPDLRHRDQLSYLLMYIAQQAQTSGGKLLTEAPWGACVDSVVNSMRSMKAKNPSLRAVILDHFHVLSRHKNASRNDSSMLEERAYKLMTASKELDIDLFVLAQMNQVGIKVGRESNKNGEPEPAPQLDQIRGTDALSHVSHAVWLVRNQKEIPTDGPRERKLEIWHSKVRGRQAIWEPTEDGPQISTIHDFIKMSLIQIDYNVSSLKSDDTSFQIKSSRSRSNYL